MRGDSTRVVRPVLPEGGGSSPTSPLHRKRALVTMIEVSQARDFIEKHHSRLPATQKGPWQNAFGMFYDGELVATALWHNCSARNLPQTWRELRRMAVADTAPLNSASFMLSQMCRWFRANTSSDMLVSYQDISVHRGTMYLAAGWTPVAISRPRFRDRAPLRTGTNRLYRSDKNGSLTAAAAKIRWQLGLRHQKLIALTADQISDAAKLKATK